jgi:hypothetical protein
MMTPKRPRDPNQLAKSIIDIATGQAEEGRVPSFQKAKSGAKGGVRRAGLVAAIGKPCTYCGKPILGAKLRRWLSFAFIPRRVGSLSRPVRALRRVYSQSPRVIRSPRVPVPSTNSGASSDLNRCPPNFGYCVENERLWIATYSRTRPFT